MTDVASELRAAFAEALATFDLAARVEAEVEKTIAKARAPHAAIAIGKAALTMLRGAERAGATYQHALAIVPEGVDASGVRAEVIEAAHPIPDERSVRAGERALELAASRRSCDLHVFVSGGASALACVPSAGIDLAVKRDVTRALLASRADIAEANVVRRHLSRIKGGGLLAATHASVRVHTFVASDVLGGELHDVGSGPSVADRTTTDDARAVLARHAPSFRDLPLVETVKPSDECASRATATVVADADSFARYLASALGVRGHRARVLTPRRGIAMEELAAELEGHARVLAPREAIVWPVEPSHAIPSNAGRGGRATHLAAAMIARLPPGVALLAGATDGVDGASGTGGAVVTSGLAPRADVERALASFDSATLLRALGATLGEGPTGVNFSDVVVMARA